MPRYVRLSYKVCGTAFDFTGQKTKNFGEVNIGVKKTTTVPIVNRCKTVALIRLSKSRNVSATHIKIEKSDEQVIYLALRPYASK